VARRKGAARVRRRLPSEQAHRRQALLAHPRDGGGVPDRRDVRDAEGRGGREFPDPRARRGGRAGRRRGRRRRHDRRSGRDPAVPGRGGAEREQGGVEALQQHDRHDERRIRPYTESRHTVAAPGGCERRARDRVGRHRRTVDRGGDASRDSRRVPARRAHDYGGELRREARAPSFLLAKDSGMSDVVTLSLTTPPEHALVADCITADRLAALGEKEIGELPVLHGGRAARMGDFFRVTGGRSGTVRLEGDLSRAEGIGARMAGGGLVIEGHGGRDLGVAMSGGRNGEVARPATFRYACTYHPPHVALLLRYVGLRCRVDVTPAQVAGRYERYSGDLAELGRGELLRWVGGGA